MQPNVAKVINVEQMLSRCKANQREVIRNKNHASDEREREREREREIIFSSEGNLMHHRRAVSINRHQIRTSIMKQNKTTKPVISMC